MSEKNQTIKQGAGLYNFDALLNQTEETPTERELVVPEEEVETSVEEEAIEDTTETEGTVEDSSTEEEEVVKDFKEEEEDKSSENSNLNNYANLAQKYISLGTWQDAEIEIDGKNVTLSELTDLDEDTFLEIVKAQDAQKNSDIAEKFIDKSDLDEISLKIIEISKNGGDIKDVLKAKETYIDNLNTYDLDNENHQELLVRQMYKMDNPNLSEKQIDNLVSIDKNELELDLKAKEFADNLKASYHAMLDKQKEQTENLKLEKERGRKELRKNLRDTLIEYGISKDSIMKPLIDSATVEVEGRTVLDQQISEMKSDPKELAEFLLWKNNREDYYKRISEKETSKVKKDTLIKLNMVKGKHSGNKTNKDAANNDTGKELAKSLKFI